MIFGKQALVILGYFITLLKAQSNVYQPLSSKITWTNIGIDPPKITVFFQTDFTTVGTISDLWLRVSVPWLTYKLNAEWSSIPPNSCATDNLLFQSTVEERIDADEIWTTFFLQLKGSTYTPMATYALKFQPDRYLDFVGFSDSLKIAFISKNVDGYVTYAYNNAFSCMYGVDSPTTDLTLNDYTDDPNRIKLNKIIESYVVVQIKDGVAERLLFKAVGDYQFADDAEIKCTSVEDLKSNINLVPRDDYKCSFFQEIGSIGRTLLAFTWNKGKIKGGIYKFKFTLKSPVFGGSHSLILYAMDRAGSRIKSTASLMNVFKTVPSPWAPNFPKLVYSFGIAATDESLPQGLGLFSTTKGFNVQFNSLVFSFKSFEEIPAIPAADSFSITVNLGTTAAICPLGSIYHDLNVAPGKSRIVVSYSAGVIRFDNVYMFNSKVYKISAKVGYPDTITLPSDSDNGFGYISLIYKSFTIFKSQVITRKGFNKVFDNKSLLTNAYVKSDDDLVKKRKHRGVSAFRSAYGLLNNELTYLVQTDRHGLRKGDGQDLILQTSVGPNFLYYPSTLDIEHDSSKTFFQMITSAAITSKTSSWEDKFKASNCRIQFGAYPGKWDTDFVKADMQPIVTMRYTGVIIDVEPTGVPKYDFLGGCSYNVIQGEQLRYSRFRFRFQDVFFTYNAALPVGPTVYPIRGVETVLIDNLRINTPGGIRGNIFVWKNIDIRSYPSQINFGESDSVVLDMFFQVFFFSTSAVTDDDLTSTPSIALMENLYVFGDVDTPFSAAAVTFAPHLQYMDYNGAALGIKLTANYGDKWPNVMHFYGTYGNFDDRTFAIRIFFDFIEPLTVSEDSLDVACSVFGLAVSKCEFTPGMPDVILNNYRDTDNSVTTGYSFNSRYAHALTVYLVPPTNLAAPRTFSLTFPFRHTITTNTDNLNLEYTSLTQMSPSIMIIDNTFTPLQYIDYGAGFDYQTWAFHTSLFGNYALQLSTAPAQLDDAVPNNNPVDSTWADIPASSLVGASPPTAVPLKHNCQACASLASAQDFGAAMLCGPWNFFKKATFAADNLQTDPRYKCHKLSYYFNGPLYGQSAANVSCLYCPGAVGVGPTFANDASAAVFTMTDFLYQDYTGLLWPASTYGVVGGQIITGYTPFTSLTKTLAPNLITIHTSAITVRQQKLSMKLLFSFTFSNPLPYGSSIYLNKLSGGFLFFVYGKDQKPLCRIRRAIVNLHKCEFLFVSSGIQINIFDTIPAARLDIELYGISIGTVTTLPDITFEVTSYLDQLRTANLAIDKSALGSNLVISYGGIESSGSLTLSALRSNIWQQLAYGDLSFTVVLADRDILVSDFFSVNLGAGSITPDTSTVTCMVTAVDGLTIRDDVAVCNAENLNNIVIRFKDDSLIKTFVVKVNNIVIPQFSTPGVTMTYKFNGDYTAFTSNELVYSNLINVPQFQVKTTGEFKLDGRGQRSDLLLTITPDSNIAVFRVLYIKFDPSFIPSLTMYSFQVYQESNGQILRSWIAGPGLLAVTGWLFSIEGKLPYTIRIVGVDVPSSTAVRTMQVLFADETGLSTIIQWGMVTIAEAPSIQTMNLIFIDDLRYDRNIIRINSGLELDLIFTRTAPKYIYMRIFFDYLTNEIFKTWNPVCKLFAVGSTANLITPCKTLGTRVDFYLEQDLVQGVVYTLRIDDVLNPDFGFCEPIPPRIIVSNAKQTKTIMVSSNMVDNYKRIPFKNEANMKILNFVSIPTGALEVWRGFYDKVDIGPVASYVGERTFYTDKVTYTLSYDLDGLFASDVIFSLGINSFESKIGQSRAPFVIGANKNTVLTDYILYILRSEKFARQYTDLPLLKVKILPNQARVMTPSKIIVFKGAGSLPVNIYPEKIPTISTTFKVSFVESFTAGVTINDDITEVVLALDTPLVFIGISADSSTTITSLTLRIQKKDPTSPFIDKLVPVEIQPNSITADPLFQLNTRDITQFGGKVDFSSDQVLYILYYILPTYEYKAFTKSTVEAWVKRGITSIGDIKVGYGLIDNPVNIVTVTLTDLLAETEYTVRAFYMSPLKNNKVFEKVAVFTTSPRNLINGVLSLEVKEPLFLERKMALLCKLAIKFAIPAEDLWTDDGINCESENMNSFVRDWHQASQGVLNETIAREKDSFNQESLNHLRAANVFIFGSRREFQPSDIYSLLFQETRLDTSLTTFQSAIGDLATLSYLGNEIILRLSPTPAINGSPTSSISGLEVAVSGISLSVDGYLLMVYGRKEQFGATVTISDLKDVSSYSGFKYDAYKSGASISVKLKDNISENIDYSVYMVAFNNDPRKSAKVSAIQKIDFIIKSAAAVSSAGILLISQILLLLIVFL
jgi:hypothetical protein